MDPLATTDGSTPGECAIPDEMATLGGEVEGPPGVPVPRGGLRRPPRCQEVLRNREMAIGCGEVERRSVAANIASVWDLKRRCRSSVRWRIAGDIGYQHCN